MGKGIWIGAILIIVILGIGAYFIFFNGAINVSEIQPWDLESHSLKQSEVKAILGNQEVENYAVSPAQSLSQETYDKIQTLRPVCLEKLNLGEGVRIVTLNTPNRDITVVYSTESNKIECVISENK